MFRFLFRKEDRLEGLIDAYLDTLVQTQEHFDKALHSCVEDPLCPEFDFQIRQTHKYESRADDIRDEINNLMYGKTLIPESRGDVMALVAEIEAIPALFERILYLIQTQRLMIPALLMADIDALVRVSLECCDLVVRQVRALFAGREGIRSLLTSIDTHESHCDHMERRIVARIFDSDVEPMEKLQLKELVEKIGDISDRADKISKRISIMRMKRRV